MIARSVRSIVAGSRIPASKALLTGAGRSSHCRRCLGGTATHGVGVPPGRNLTVRCEDVPLLLDARTTRFVDCGSVEAYVRAHIPHALRLPCDASTRDPHSPHHVLSPDQFNAVSAHLGLRQDHHLVVYDAGSTVAAARVWWMFLYYGARHVALLDGGWHRYAAVGGGRIATGPESGLPEEGVEEESPSPPLLASPQHQHIAVLDDVLHAVHAAERSAVQLVDVRTPGEFSGSDLRGLRFGGHPPGAVNVPHAGLMTPDRTFRRPEELRRVFEAAGLDPSKKQITYCLGGMRSAIGLAALRLAGYTHSASYDASMEEWNNTPGLPREP